MDLGTGFECSASSRFGRLWLCFGGAVLTSPVVAFRHDPACLPGWRAVWQHRPDRGVKAGMSRAAMSQNPARSSPGAPIAPALRRSELWPLIRYSPVHKLVYVKNQKAGCTSIEYSLWADIDRKTGQQTFSGKTHDKRSPLSHAVSAARSVSRPARRSTGYPPRNGHHVLEALRTGSRIPAGRASFVCRRATAYASSAGTASSLLASRFALWGP